MEKNLKKQLFTQFSLIAKSLSNGHRLELLEFLAQGDRSVEELARLSGLSIANTSQHLQSLRRCGLVDTRSEGHHVFYRLSDYQIMEVIGSIQKIARQNLGAIDQLVTTYLTSKDDLEPMSRDELLDKARKGLITVVDVRPVEEYRAGHLPNAINIQLSKLKDELERIPRSTKVIAYCRGPFCVLAFDAVEQLRSLGYDAQRLEDGFPEWKLDGLPIEKED
ncbi:MAG: metalloregulator ArsR/SmtB family transcription factor [Pseudomonadota bacterium]